MYNCILQICRSSVIREERRNESRVTCMAGIKLFRRERGALSVAASSAFMWALMLGHLHIPRELGPRFSIRSFPCCKKSQYNQSVNSLLLDFRIGSCSHLLPAANFCARRMFCLLFHQHAANTTRNKKAKSTPKAIPIFAATDK